MFSKILILSFVVFSTIVYAENNQTKKEMMNCTGTDKTTESVITLRVFPDSKELKKSSDFENKGKLFILITKKDKTEESVLIDDINIMKDDSAFGVRYTEDTGGDSYLMHLGDKHAVFVSFDRFTGGVNAPQKQISVSCSFPNAK